MVAPRACAAIASLLLFSTGGHAAPAAPLQPVTPWDVDYAETHCIAMRDYGSPDRPLTFGVIPAPNGETYELLVARKRVGPTYAEELEGSVDFGRGPIKAWLLRWGSKNAKQALDMYKYRITAAEMQQARTAPSVTLHVRSGPDVSFSLALMPQLLDELEKCTADLKNYWNMGANGASRVSTPAVGDVRTIFSPNDYPSEAFSRRQEGTVQFLLLIDEKGSVAACHVVRPSGVPILDAQGCAVIQKRAKFSPARDAKGTPVRDTVVTPPVVWRVG